MEDNWWIETSPSGRATCRECHELIKKGCLRLRYHTTSLYGHPEYCYYHARCCHKFIVEEVERLDKIIRKIEKYLKGGGENKL